MEYLVALFAFALPSSIFGLIGSIVYRKSTQSAIVSGVVGAISLPLVIFFTVGSRPDTILAAAVYGVLFGWTISRVAK